MANDIKFSAIPQLTKEVVRRICSFFHTFESTRGYDIKTPIGEIANEAYHHWVRVTTELDTIRAEVRRLRDNNQLLKVSNDTLRCENTELKDINTELRNELAWFYPSEVEPMEGKLLLCQNKIGDDSYFVGWYHFQYKEVWNSPYDNEECSKVGLQDVLRYKYIK